MSVSGLFNAGRQTSRSQDEVDADPQQDVAKWIGLFAQISFPISGRDFSHAFEMTLFQTFRKQL